MPQAAQYSSGVGGFAALNRPDSSALSERANYGYIPGLDGLRAIAVGIVIAAHFGLSHIVPGGFGVTVFFFISGFLITRLLLAETGQNGRIDLKRFYLRRLVRLVPALLFMVLGSTAYFWTMGYGAPSQMEVLAALFYFTNVFQVNAAVQGGDMPFMSWTHLWSLAVEEHFYLLFPLIMILSAGVLRRLKLSLVLVILTVPFWRLYTHISFDGPVDMYTYMMTDARIDSIAWGCLLSIILHQLGDVTKLRKLIGFVPFGLAIVAILVSFLIRDAQFRDVWRFSLQGGALFVLFLNFYYLRGLRFCIALMEYRHVAWLGRLSYGLYLWHYPVLDALLRGLGPGWFTVYMSIWVSLALTALSYYLIEQPFNRLRKRLGSKPISRPI